MPGFRAWLETSLPHLTSLPGGVKLASWIEKNRGAAAHRAGLPDEALRELLLQLCAHYLTRLQRNDDRPADPVARFHLRNGARLERINWAADGSPRGLAQSAGIMVNYLYELDEVERNHEAYINEGKITASRRVEGLARALHWPEPARPEPAHAQ